MPQQTQQQPPPPSSLLSNPQIVRDPVPAVDPAEPRSRRSWEWVCSALVQKEGLAADSAVAINLLDAVFVQKDQIWSWFYSSTGGIIRKKSQRKLQASHVLQRFHQAAADDGEASSSAPTAVCWFDEQQRLQLLSGADLSTFLHTCKGQACLSPYVAPRGGLDPTRFANLEHEFVLHKTGRAQTKLFRVALGGQRILSMDSKLNAYINSVVELAVSTIERNRRERVVACNAYFVLDDLGHVFLWRIDRCETIPTRLAPSSQSHSITRAYEGPHAINERLLARARHDSLKQPDESLIDAILSSPTPHRRRPLRASASQPALPETGRDLVAPSFDPFAEETREQQNKARGKHKQRGIDWADALQFLPTSSSLSRERQRALSAAHLASSQRCGCCGDYCRLDISQWTSKRLQSSEPSIAGASSGGPRASRVDLPASTGGHRSNSVVSATAAASAFLAAHPDSGSAISGTPMWLSKPLSPQRQQLDERDRDRSQVHAIPFKLIAQTRAEKQLVELFLRRYQRGEDGDYLAEEYYGEGEPLGQTFPGYYYQDVQVCDNCFTLYTLIERVRMKAIEQLTKRRRTVGSKGTAVRRLPDVTEDDTLSGNHEAVRPLGLWRRAWTHAQQDIVPSITKQDAAELYSFVNPHPAVTMVLNALGHVLLGREVETPSEFKRLLAQDRLLTTLQSFTLDQLTMERVNHVTAHIRNPLFAPEHITPVSSCAARFCDWYDELLPYAWRNADAFAGDRPTWSLLALRKPELLPPDVVATHQYGQADGAEQATVARQPRQRQPRRRDRRGQADHSAATPTATAAARRAIQEQQMIRLAAPTGLVDGLALGGAEQHFTCSDGVTQLPYTITGQAVAASSKCNLVVFHDLFDTMDSTKVFFRSVLAKHVGARALFFNLPGQAGTMYPAQAVVFNNAWYAHRVHELLEHLQHTKRFLTTGLPFHVVGFGNGANVATSFALHYGRHPSYRTDLQSLVLFNGFASVDTQLAAILHSTANVFACLPPSRPDLPVTFFCKYLFSDAYLAKIDLNLALSIYTAVTNPITLDGRLRIVQGALHHVDLSARLSEIEVPLVIVQSIENALVAPTNVDPFLQGRVNIAHAWSHQTSSTGAASATLNAKTRRQMLQVLSARHSAFVSWLRAGHELRQEAKAYVSELLELLVCSQELLATSVPLNAEAPSPTDKPPAPSSPTEGVKVTPTPTAIAVDRPDAQAVPSPTIKTPVAPAPSTQPGSTLKEKTVKPQVTHADAVFPQHRERAERELEAVKQGARQPERREPQATAPPLSTLRPPRVEHVPARPPPVTVVPEPASVVAEPTPTPTLTAPVSALAPLDSEIDAVRARIAAEEQRLLREAEELRERQRRAAEERLEALRLEQERRRRQWEEEDNARLAALEQRLKEEEAARDAARRQREQDRLLADSSVLLEPPAEARDVAATAHEPASAKDALIAPTLTDMKQRLRTQPELPSLFDQLEAEERARRRVGVLRVDEFEQVQTAVTRNYESHVRQHESSLRQELFQRKQRHAVRIQAHIRRYLAVRRVCRRREELQLERIRRFAGAEIVRIVRGFLGRRRFLRYRTACELAARRRGAAIALQRLFRGHVCRVRFRRLRRNRRATIVQRVYRGHVARRFCEELREQQRRRRFLDRNATLVQATWRMHAARDRFLRHRITVLAATEIQRLYRGRLGRLEAARKKAWRDAEPGPERLALGLRMIESSKQAFERQQSELDALHRAQETVERQVSSIHAELQESEKELAVLERELQEIDQLEADLRELTHEAELLHHGGLDGLLRTKAHSSPTRDQSAPQPLGNGVPPRRTSSASGMPMLAYEVGMEEQFETDDVMRQRQADAYAVEMAIQIKRAEREKRKKDLEAEFTSVFAEVQTKRQALAEMEEKLADMEATRMRKDREFARMQRNLMELLEEQKLELEHLREKGIELEAATATSAAAAAATALKAKEHEKRSQAMFESTEELMKFQFMSMSLSYFSSLSMLKNLRDINADTTAAAISSTAETAAAAAAAAAAANIPTMKRLQVGGADLMTAASQLKKTELEQKLKEEEDVARAAQQALPDEVRQWTVDDVGRWLDTLALPQYKKAFHEGAVDGEFLLELRPEDMSDVLGVAHKLHVRKILVARNKLLPLSQQEQLQIAAVEHESRARNARQQVIGGGAGGGGGGNGSSASASPVALDIDTVFSQARNGRLKRLIESVDAGFDINSEDDKGNTLLLIACQNVNVKMVEYLVGKRANVNHKNAQGNTPLHFAMAYDAEGKLGEYLIAHGADDTIENVHGLTPYDGLTAE
ncbi:hypothetical protein P43SY_002044 [Pythium insidiosum]|uniref:SAM domain-containing protein n=1 Tax=Pythium insidiosum TaxID=114742 RepID=A0AAD5M6V8_PYTIN|nr:hypothetical protein P43SY_002044 [Pythium insidiosum]